jgi:hypothetical protein
MLQTPETFNPKSSFTDLSMREVFLTGMWTVFMSNFLSSLLLLCDVVCWNGKIATPVGFSFSVIVLLL